MKVLTIGNTSFPSNDDTLQLTIIEHKGKKPRKELMVEAYERWAGDSYTGFGATANLYLTEKEAIQLLDFLLQNFQPSSGK